MTKQELKDALHKSNQLLIDQYILVAALSMSGSEDIYEGMGMTVEDTLHLLDEFRVLIDANETILNAGTDDDREEKEING